WHEMLWRVPRFFTQFAVGGLLEKLRFNPPRKSGVQLSLPTSFNVFAVPIIVVMLNRCARRASFALNVWSAPKSGANFRRSIAPPPCHFCIFGRDSGQKRLLTYRARPLLE